MKNKKVLFEDLGLMDYKSCWDYQEALFNGIVAQKIANRDLELTEHTLTNNYLIFVEHPHVYTLGKSGDQKNLLVDSVQLQEKEASYYKINRGGDITYHGPGQLVVYPVLDLDNFFTDIHKYLRLLEETIILTLNDYGIVAGRSEGETGVWINPENKIKARKICAMGVRCSRWVTMHGLGFNVNVDLDYFDNIVPCGISDKKVTSMDKELQTSVDVEEVKSKIKKYFCELFECILIKETISHKMRASELIVPAEDVLIAIVPEETDGEKSWMVYLVNLKNHELTNVLITSNGYGELNEKHLKTSTLRHYIENVPAKTFSKIEPIIEEVFGLSNEYWLSFYLDKTIYDKKFVFLPETILESNCTIIPLLNRKGVMIK